MILHGRLEVTRKWSHQKGYRDVKENTLGGRMFMHTYTNLPFVTYHLRMDVRFIKNRPWMCLIIADKRGMVVQHS